MGEYLTVLQAAAIMGRHPGSLYRMLQSGAIAARKHGAVWLIHKQELKRFSRDHAKVTAK